MNNMGSTLAKVVVFAGGVLAGVMLTEWIDKLLATQGQGQGQSECDGSHYAQGLQPCSQPPADEDDQVER